MVYWKGSSLDIAGTWGPRISRGIKPPLIIFTTTAIPINNPHTSVNQNARVLMQKNIVKFNRSASTIARIKYPILGSSTVNPRKEPRNISNIIIILSLKSQLSSIFLKLKT